MLMTQCCEAYSNNMNRQDTKDKSTSERYTHALSRRIIPDMFQCLVGNISPFALARLLDEIDQANNYRLSATGANGFFLVSRLTCDVDQDDVDIV